ncbi:MAG TPA: hypothetical protein PLO89_05365 [Spirochaetota bacterium]|nr:hypothetical protein [Spirochaetota bacterium]
MKKGFLGRTIEKMEGRPTSFFYEKRILGRTIVKMKVRPTRFFMKRFESFKYPIVFLL